MTFGYPEGRIRWLTGRTLAWAGFDIMSSAYIGIVPNVFFPIYFQRFVAEGDATAAWGLLAAVGIVISGLAALGTAALARRISRLGVMLVATCGLIASLMFLSVHSPNSIWIASAAYVVAQSCYFGATTLYESYLPEIVPAETVGRVSGFGWAFGYTGGIAVTIVLLATLERRPDGVSHFQSIFAIVATWTALLAVPVFAMMRWQGFAHSHPVAGIVEHIGIRGAVRGWRSQRPIFVLLLGMTLINSAIAVVVSFTAPILSSNFGQNITDLLWLLLLLQTLSMPTTLIGSMLSDKWSKHKAIMLVLSGWSIILLLLAFARGAWTPWIIVAVLACCLGTTNAVMRGFLAQAVRPDQSTAFFGIFTFVGRIASAVGPLLFVMIARIAGERVALLAIIAVLIAGAAILRSYLRGGVRSLFLPETMQPRSMSSSHRHGQET